eukprot:3604142-Alexandrium_andersonii.AAC.1
MCIRDRPWEEGALPGPRLAAGRAPLRLRRFRRLRRTPLRAVLAAASGSWWGRLSAAMAVAGPLRPA